MRMRLLFLDVDGVINSDAWYDQYLSAGERIPRPPIDPVAVARLDQIVRETGAHIVLSTSWRLGYPELPRWLVERGCSGVFVGVTPDLWPRDRGHEIAMWLNETSRKGVPIRNVCILDDNADMASLTPWLVQTDHRVGLQDHDVDRAVALLLKS